MKKIKLSTGVEVEMREPKVKDLRALTSILNEQEKELSLVSNLTGLTSIELDELSLKDYGLIKKELEGFLS